MGDFPEIWRASVEEALKSFSTFLRFNHDLSVERADGSRGSPPPESMLEELQTRILDVVQTYIRNHVFESVSTVTDALRKYVKYDGETGDKGLFPRSASKVTEGRGRDRDEHRIVPSMSKVQSKTPGTGGTSSQSDSSRRAEAFTRRAKMACLFHTAAILDVKFSAENKSFVRCSSSQQGREGDLLHFDSLAEIRQNKELVLQSIAAGRQQPFRRAKELREAMTNAVNAL